VKIALIHNYRVIASIGQDDRLLGAMKVHLGGHEVSLTHPHCCVT